jgi:hypothetical protein
MDSFIELKSTDKQTVFVRKSAVGAFEVVPSSSHVDGHIKIYVSGYKFLVQVDQQELLKKLNE